MRGRRRGGRGLRHRSSRRHVCDEAVGRATGGRGGSPSSHKQVQPSIGWLVHANAAPSREPRRPWTLLGAADWAPTRGQQLDVHAKADGAQHLSRTQALRQLGWRGL